MMNSGNGKRLVICDKEKKNKRAKFTETYDGQFDFGPYLPEELILENIVIRLSARDLAKWSCTSKYWYKSILGDSRFASSHFDHNKNKLNLVFNLLNVFTNGRSKGYFLSVEEEEEKDNDVGGFLLNYRLLMDMACMTSHELVGYCNGLVCTKLVCTTAQRGKIGIINPTRSETLSLDYLTPPSCRLLCHGFCFDSLSKSYKVVIIYTTTSTITGNQEFVCMVLSLGGGGRGTNTNSWKKIVTSSAQISPPPGSAFPFPGRIVTRTSRNTRRSATLCGGTDLVWRITNRISKNNKIDMLLSFNIHDEKIRFISLPTECSLTRTTTTTRNEHQYCVVDHHLLEFKGYLCVARSEKIMIPKSRHHSHQHHRRHRRLHCNGKTSRFCCCGFKVHLFVLEDKINQVWIKRETFDLQMKEEGLLPAPFCCYFDTATSTTTATPPTRMLSFSDQLLLYWSDGEYLLLYNLQMRYLKVVKCSSSCKKQSRDIFETKMKNGIRPGRCIGDDDNWKFPYMDYQLHAQAENILSLKTFIPEGETRKFYSNWEFEQSMKTGEKEEPAGLLYTRRESIKYHAFN